VHARFQTELIQRPPPHVASCATAMLTIKKAEDTVAVEEDETKLGAHPRRRSSTCNHMPPLPRRQA